MGKMLTSGLVLFSILHFFACESESYPVLTIGDPIMTEDSTATTPNSDDETQSIKYLALGDSYTIGESVAESERWPNQLQKLLVNAGIEVSKPDILARTGWTTNELKGAIANSTLQNKYQLVSLLIGVNNQYRGYPKDQQRLEFEDLLLRSIEFAQGDTTRVFVVSIPDYGATPFGQSRNPVKIGEEIDEYNAINKTICDRYGVLYFDITPISRQAVDNPDLIAPDELHPSGLMYQRWVNQVIGQVVADRLKNEN